jgi:hypothetical protein
LCSTRTRVLWLLYNSCSPPPHLLGSSDGVKGDWAELLAVVLH